MYSCGVDEQNAYELQICLHFIYGWEYTWGFLHTPPDNIQPGDIIIYHSGPLDNTDIDQSHAALVVQGPPNVKIASHSPNHYGIEYNYMADSKPYYQWLHYTGK